MPTNASQNLRIACVQNGDYAAALSAARLHGDETYQGQFATVESFERFAAPGRSLVLAIGTKPARLERREGTIVTFARGQTTVLPGRCREYFLARRMIRELRRFNPTHLILRLTDVVGVHVLQWAVKRKIPTSIIIASTLEPRRSLDRRFCSLANAPNVSFVANHLRVATESLTLCGLHSSKAVEYDFPGRLSPDDFPVKSINELNAALPNVLYVGVLSEEKGAGDILAACKLLESRNAPVRLTVCGDGELCNAFQLEHVAGRLNYLGRVGRKQVVEIMSAATLAIVPSRRSFAEGLPLTLLEALATRTPVIASAHPVFTKYFHEGVGVTFFKPGDPTAMADAVQAILAAPNRYAELSRTSADAWRSAQTSTTFDDLFKRMRSHFGRVSEPTVSPRVQITASASPA